MNLQVLGINDIPIGKPLPWQLYDHERSPIFPRGEIIGSPKEIEALIAEGLYRDLDEVIPPGKAPTTSQYRVLHPNEIFPPDGIKPQIGERVQLRLLGGQSQTYYTSRLIGYIRDTSILLTAPMAAGKRIDIGDSELLECRMLNGSNIYIFQSEIVRACTSPAHYLHLQYPQSVRVQKLRNAPRARVRIAATPTDSQGRQSPAQILDLSPDGCLLVSPADLGPAGQALKISFVAAVDELQTTLNLKGSIQHVRVAKASADGSPEVLEYGIAFGKCSEEERLWLKSTVYQHIAEGFLA